MNTYTNKTTHFKIATALLALTIILFGCSKEWLEEKPDKRMTVPESLSDLQKLLDNVTTMNMQCPIAGENASDNHFVTDETFLNAPKDFLSDAYIWTRTTAYTFVGDWNQSYTKILADNVILNQLEKIIPDNNLDKESWEDIKGQALFNRGKTYFELSQIFSLPYGTADNNNLGIVLRENSDITVPSRRSSITETYHQIVKDLTESFELLPNTAQLPTRGSKAAAAAMLSRVYLSMADYNNALQYANEVLKIRATLMDYNTLTPGLGYIGRYNPEVLYHSNFNSVFTTFSCLIEESFYNLYNEKDLRRSLFFRQNPDETIVFTGTYESLNYNLFNGLATDEVYLTRAECLARLNKTDEAMSDLNKLMKSRWDNTVDYIPIEAASPEDALGKILVERNKELILRGIRWTDLRRLNQDQRFAKTLTRTVGGTTYTLEPNSNRYALAIPDDIIKQTGLEQNTGWKN